MERSANSLPLPTYSASGVLPQGPGRAAESPAEARTCGTGVATRDRSDDQRLRPSRHLSPKSDPPLIAGDQQHFAAIAESLEQSISALSDRLEAERKAPGGIGQEAMDRGMEVHRLTARLRTLRRFGLDLCLGRMVSPVSPHPVYVGRLGLTDNAGRRLLLDRRSPPAEAVFGATHANPRGPA